MLRGALGRVGAGALGRQVARGVMSGAGAAPQGVNGAVNGAARPAPPGPATGGRNPSAGLTGEEKFLFDAAGYFVARQVRPPSPGPPHHRRRLFIVVRPDGQPPAGAGGPPL